MRSFALGNSDRVEPINAPEWSLAADFGLMEKLHRIGSLFVSNGDLQTIMTEIVDAALFITGTDMGNLQICDPQSDRLKIIAHRGFEKPWIDFWENVKTAHGACGAAIKAGGRIIVEDVTQSKIFAGTPALDIQLAAGVRAVQFTPLVGRSGQPLGILSTYFRKPHRPTEQTLRQIDLLASQATAILESFGAANDVTERKQAEAMLQQANQSLKKRVVERTAELEQRVDQLQQLAVDLSRTEDRERRRLAEILHDDFQQEAAYIKIELDRLARLAETDMHQPLVRLAQFADGFIEKMRHLAYTLDPPALAHSGLMVALNVLAKEMQTQHGLRVTLRTQAGAEPTSSVLSSMVYRSVRELLFNAVNHAGVNDALVEIRCQDKRIRIKVADKGKGFDYPAVRNGKGGEKRFGLDSIRDRITFLGGTMQIKAKPGKGSCIVLTVPREISSCPTASERPRRTICGRPSTALESASIAARPDDGKTIRILLAEDHRLFRQGLSELLQNHPDMTIVGEAVDGNEAIELAARLRPHVILMDVTMPHVDGVDATIRITRNHPDIRVIGLSMHADDDTRQRMLKAGAVAYLTKTDSPEKLLKTIHRVHRGSRKMTISSVGHVG